MFPVTNGILVHVFGYVSDELSTYRLHMATCTGFCFFGVAWLLRDGKELYQHSIQTSQKNELEKEQSRMNQKTRESRVGSGGGSGKCQFIL